MGSQSDPWISNIELAVILKQNRQDFPKIFHKYVSSDPSVRTDGSSIPAPAKPTRFSIYPLNDIALAAAACFRTHPSDIRLPSKTRTLFLHLAYQQGWTNSELLAEACKIKRRTGYYALARSAKTDFSAPLLCLGDPRLRRPECFQ